MPDGLYEKAVEYNLFRGSCKKYLRNVGIDYDKFTMVEHDSIVGFVSEEIVLNHLKTTYPNISVSGWDDQFDLDRIKNIIENKSQEEEDIDYVKTYFYDQWDLKITTSKSELFVDVKSASTAKSPSGSWNFLYPKVQVEKDGKDGAILGYCVVTNPKDISTLQSFELVGYIPIKSVSNCKLQLKGTLTRFGTVSQIDNYITELSRDYENLKSILG